MDTVVFTALEEICSHGVNGLAITELWPKLHSHLSSNGLDSSPTVKKALWDNLLSIPGLQFESKGTSYGPGDPLIQSFEDSEKLNLKIVAVEHLRNSFVGIYDIKASDAGISQVQRRALERLAIARTNGVAQSELAKEFGMKGNNIFYVLRNLECRGLIVRQPTIIRKKETCNDGGPKNSSIITTNMLHLHRYAKHLGSQQRLEITKEDKTIGDHESADCSAASGDVVFEDCIKEDVHVKDYLPALRAICDKLEKADGKVLVVSDIKRDLGYRRTSGHRAWRNILHRLKDAHVVEEFCGKVNQKEVSCLRLLKKFSPKLFDPKTLGGGNDDSDAEEPAKQGRRGHITDQLVELPIEHQIFDMIDTEGSKGLTITEVCKRLGISNKRYYTRLLTMFSRFGMHLEPESHNRGVAYRVWTTGNYNPSVSNILPSKLEDIRGESSSRNTCVDQENSVQTIQGGDYWASKYDTGISGEHENVAVESGISHGSPTLEHGPLLLGSSSSQNLACETSRTVPEPELRIVCTGPVSDVVSSDAPACTSSMPPRRRSYQTYPCLNLNAASALREQRILEMLQEKKFLIKAELHRHLESLEKEKHTMMDRKTLERSLIKLQQGGHCKCIRVSVPVVTNCGRSRTMDVVLHPSVYNVSPDLLAQIHERLRSFDMQVRGQGSSRLKKGQSVPVLESIERIHKSLKLNDQAERSEAMRANGFILAKMVRSKLLHIFLWGYLNSLPGWDDALSSGKHGYDRGNPHSSCILLDIESAIRAMPLELFLQVAGSTQKYENMVEKCRIGLCLSDLPLHEYKTCMDTQATGRLSYLIDILRRLKLIRLVSEEVSDASEVPHATLRHSLELKPYIEEPVSTVLPSPGYVSPDLRPHIRHDFVLSNRKAVDEYWSTLEYSYAAADSKAALHAFPGSAVHEVFTLRSWASVRVMTADQRAQLIKRIVDDRKTKLSFKECEEIAGDLSLTLEQVLRVYYDKRQSRLNRLHGALNAKSEEFQPRKRKRVSRKRKNSSEGKGMNEVKDDTHVESGEEGLAKLSDADDQFTEVQNSFITSSVEHEYHMLGSGIADHSDGVEELNKNDEDDYPSIHECALSRLKPARQKKFSWTEDADKQLLIEYVRHRAALGAKYHRTDWSSLPNLPAPPVTCRRRMALLNSSTQFRKAVMRLCNKLTERYAKHLGKFQKKSSGDDHGSMIRNFSYREGSERNLCNNIEHIDELNFKEQWDDFDNPNVKIALHEVLRYKQMAKLEAAQNVGSYSECSGPDFDAEGHGHHNTRLLSSATPNFYATRKLSARRSDRHRAPYIKLMNRRKGSNRREYESVAVANSAELFKLVFLNTSTAPGVPNLLAETLRRYSEHDLFAAFNYLRERKIMVGGNGSSPFGLSQPFLQNISSSPFPPNTGERAVKMASWLHGREKEMLEEGVDLYADLQCGDVFHLCALVSSGEVSISPCLPDEGVGEAEGFGKLKRKSDNSEISGGEKPKKLKTILAGEGEIISRREKGFPGIRLSLSCATISRVNALTLFKDGDFQSVAFPLGGSDQGNTSSGLSCGYSSSSSGGVKEALDTLGAISKTVAATEPPWEAMTFYASQTGSLSSTQEEGSPFHPNIFKTVYSAIQKAGDQGLSMAGISQVAGILGKQDISVFACMLNTNATMFNTCSTIGEKMPELIVEVLEAFGRALKVNAYDSVHVVDSLYRSKYFLTSMASLRQDIEVDTSKEMNDDERLIPQPENHEESVTNLKKDISINTDEMHRVTILNHPKEIAQPSSEVEIINEMESYNKEAKISSERRDQVDEMSESHSGDPTFCRPILPWINGDGTINEIVYKGLVRRVLGIVMQNPGILEANVLSQMQVLNPQSCRKLLESMILDNLIVVRKMCQATSGAPPALLGRLLGSNFKKPKLIYREHFFADPMSATSFL